MDRKQKIYRATCSILFLMITLIVCYFCGSYLVKSMNCQIILQNLRPALYAFIIGVSFLAIIGILNVQEPKLPEYVNDKADKCWKIFDCTLAITCIVFLTLTTILFIHNLPIKFENICSRLYILDNNAS